jgi:PKD domain
VLSAGLMRRIARTLAPLLGAALACPTAALALVEPPVTVDGPSSAIRAVSGVALAPDGTGGIAYIKISEGVPHVFVARRLHGGWTTPLRADALPYDAQQVAIAASNHGRLLVTWVSQVATVHGRIRYGLYSAELPAGGANFSAPLVIDPNVTTGVEVDPSLAGTEPGRAIVAYRVTTYDFSITSAANPTAVQLRPGDVLADVRVARYQGTRWSRLGAVNRNPDASAPAPSPVNAPRAGIADDGSAVVAWQERDQSGTARIWARRVFGTAPAPTLPASPTTWQGEAISDDADAFALAVTGLGMAQVVTRVPGTPDGSLGGRRLFAEQLPVSLDQHAGTFLDAVAVDGGPLGGAVGAPDVAVADGGQSGASRVAFAAGGTIRMPGLGAAAPLHDPQPAAAPAPGDAAAQLAIDEDGGSIAAWPATGGDGLPAIAVRQELASGGVQTGLLTGRQSGDVADLGLAGDVGGDAVLGFLQGAGAGAQVVAAGVTAAPATFLVRAPAGWVRPGAARVSWDRAPSTSQKITYTVLLDGQPVAQGLTVRALRPPAVYLGNGVRHVQVVGTDADGQSIATDAVDLRVDARPPTARARSTAGRRHGRHSVAVTVADAASGVVAARTTCRFGDGSRVQQGHKTFRHNYRRAGRYVVRVVTRDRAGNRTTLRLRVTAR